MKTVILAISLSFLLAGCMNMPTPPSQITGSYTSGLKYSKFDCDSLAAEIDSLARRENHLILAQEQRIKTSEIQAFWYGYGQGDGIEASELANVRGEKEAVRTAIEKNKCESAAAILVKHDQDLAKNEEMKALNESVEKEYQECKNSFDPLGCDKESIRQKLLGEQIKEYNLNSDVTLQNSKNVNQGNYQTKTEKQEIISEEIYRKARLCQSRGGVWVNDQCIISID